jgi:hypothetical protein
MENEVLLCLLREIRLEIEFSVWIALWFSKCFWHPDDCSMVAFSFG